MAVSDALTLRGLFPDFKHTSELLMSGRWGGGQTGFRLVQSIARPFVMRRRGPGIPQSVSMESICANVQPLRYSGSSMICPDQKDPPLELSYNSQLN